MPRTMNLKAFKITNGEALDEIESTYRDKENENEFIPWAVGTSFREVAETILPDQNGNWSTPLIYTVSRHKATHGIPYLCRKASEYIDRIAEQKPIDTLSISAHMEGDVLLLKILVRAYTGSFNLKDFFTEIGDELYVDNSDENPTEGNLVIPDEIKNFRYREEEIKKHNDIIKRQNKVFDSCDLEHPFLNSIDHYEPVNLPVPEEKMDLIYDLKTSDMKTKTLAPYDQFIEIFREVMTYVSGVEKYHYYNVMQEEESEESFMNFLEGYINSTYVESGRLYREDLPTLLKKLYRSLFQLYIVQDLIDDPNVTDVKITAPDSIRARVKGKAYISNITFIDAEDYKRFVNGIAIRNRIMLNVPEQTFTDTHDEKYILRFSITADYVNSVDWPYIHIRKVDRHKLMADDLIAAGMMDEKLRDYLLDCGKHSRGVVFAGPPGSGKTVCLNWFLEEAYEQSAEILVIQENDELFAYRKGVMFQHVVNYVDPTDNTMPVSLEDLGKLALVAGANVFVIGEAKGAEICSAITLSNSGCRTAITIHTPSSTETIDKMADLAMRGYAQDYDQAKRMVRAFQTIVYLENFKITEISEVLGYNEEKRDMDYRYIYRRNAG